MYTRAGLGRSTVCRMVSGGRLVGPVGVGWWGSTAVLASGSTVAAGTAGQGETGECSRQGGHGDGRGGGVVSEPELGKEVAAAPPSTLPCPEGCRVGSGQGLFWRPSREARVVDGVPGVGPASWLSWLLAERREEANRVAPAVTSTRATVRSAPDRDQMDGEDGGTGDLVEGGEGRGGWGWCEVTAVGEGRSFRVELHVCRARAPAVHRHAPLGPPWPPLNECMPPCCPRG